MNDSTVTMVSPQHVLKQQAYILFYSKVPPPIPESKSSHIEHMKKGENNKNGNEPTITDLKLSEKNSNGSSNSKDSNIKSNSDSYIDDLGESLNPEELAGIARNHLEMMTKRNITNQQTNVKMENGSSVENAVDYEVNYDSSFLKDEEIETRLIKIKSWAVKPFR